MLTQIEPWEFQCVADGTFSGIFDDRIHCSPDKIMPGDNAIITELHKTKGKFKAFLGFDPKGEILSSGTEIEMALLFLDIRNFTPFAESHLATDVIHLVKKIFSAFEGVISERGGRIIETTGDGLYVAFSSADNDTRLAANSAVLAGYALFERLELLNKEYLYKVFGENIQIGIGIHVGKVAVGNLMLGSKEHRIVMGYPVNIAARLEGLTKKLDNSFIISEVTYMLLSNPPVSNPSLELLKGINMPIVVYPIGQYYTAP